MTATARSRPGCVLVTDGHTNQALACVRSLGRAGYDVLVASHHRWPVAAWSRWCRGSRHLPEETTEAYADLRAWAVRRGATLVFPITEAACFLCNAERGEWLAADVMVGCGPNAMLLQAFDKARTLEIAARFGLNVPETRAPGSLEECHAAARELGYPCIVKPRFSNALDGTRVTTDLGIAWVDRPEALEAAVTARRQLHFWPLLQRPVPGVGRGLFVLCDHGECVAWFAHQRLRDVRPTGSGSTLRRSAPIPPDLREAAALLMRRMAWHGPAMLEFKDDGAHPPWLMEMNGRFWGSLQLAIAAGVDFPRLWARLLEGDTVEPSDRYEVGVTLRWLWGDIRRFAHILRGRPRGFHGPYPGWRQGLHELFGRQPPGTRLETWDKGDPWPSLGQWVQGVSESFTWRTPRGPALEPGVAPIPAPATEK